MCLAVGASAASAQVVSSGPLQQVDPWGVGWLGQADGALGADTWRNTDAAALKPLMGTINPAQLSPAAQQGLHHSGPHVGNRAKATRNIGDPDKSVRRA